MSIRSCLSKTLLEGGRGLSKLAISRVIIRVTPFRALTTLLITNLLSALPLQVEHTMLASSFRSLTALNLSTPLP